MGLFYTHRNWAALFCRIAIAAVFIPHGLDKLIAFEPLGWNGPEAWQEKVFELVNTKLIPDDYKVLAAKVSAWTELIAGISCVLGLLVRVVMLPLIIDMAGAIILVHGANGFWIDHKIDGQLAPGFEYNMVLILICVGVFFSGAGSISIDKLIAGEPEYDEYHEDITYEDHDHVHAPPSTP